MLALLQAGLSAAVSTAAHVAEYMPFQRSIALADQSAAVARAVPAPLPLPKPMPRSILKVSPQSSPRAASFSPDVHASSSGSSTWGRSVTSSLPASSSRLDTAGEETDSVLEYPLSFILDLPKKPKKSVSFAIGVAEQPSQPSLSRRGAYKESLLHSQLNAFAAKAMHSKGKRLHNTLKDDVVDPWEGMSHTINYSGFDLGHLLRTDEQWENVSEFSREELKLLASQNPRISVDWLDFLDAELLAPRHRGQKEIAPPSWLPDE